MAFYIILLFCGVQYTMAVTYTNTNNQLTAIPADIPLDVTDLDLSSNDICNVNGIEYLGGLTGITMKSNCLSTFPNFCMFNATLKRIAVRFNDITTVNPGYLTCLPVLGYLDIGGNGLTTFPSVFMPAVYHLNIYANNIEELPSFNTLMPALRSVGISENPLLITDMPDALVDIGDRLETITLANFQLTHLNEDKMAKMTVLTSLKLRTNQFTQIPPMGPSTYTLTKLDMSKNPIAAVDPYHIREFTALAELNLEQCDITAVPMLCQLGQQLEINLVDNPLVCDCHSKELHVAIVMGVVIVSDFPCEEPTQMSTVHQQDLMIDMFTCLEDGESLILKHTQIYCNTFIILIYRLD